MTRHKQIVAVTLVVCALVTCGRLVHADLAEPRTWNDRIERSDALLRAGQYGKAHHITVILVDEIGRSLVSKQKGLEVLGSAYALHAMAEAGTGRHQDALWHWHLAQTMKPDLRTLDLTAYGEAGTFLSPHRLSETGACTAEKLGPEPGQFTNAEVTPPRKVHAPAPELSREARIAGVQGQVIIQTIIGADGRLYLPRVLKAEAPCLAYLALKAIRRWRFEPARHEGEPVPVYYNLTLNFSL